MQDIGEGCPTGRGEVKSVFHSTENAIDVPDAIHLISTRILLILQIKFIGQINNIKFQASK